LPTKTFALGMAAAAWLVGVAITLNTGFYTRTGLLLVTLAMIIAGVVTLLGPLSAIESLPSGVLIAIVAAALFVDVAWLVDRTPAARWGIAFVGVSGLLQAFDLGRLRKPLLGFTLLLFCGVAWYVIQATAKSPHIDVFVFQRMAAEGLLDGVNPYVDRYPNLYVTDTPFYGPAVIDANNHLTVGLPYPPMSLLLVLPGHLLAGDFRVSEVVLVAASVWLMAMAVPSRWSAAVSMLFLLMPLLIDVVGQGYTDTVFLFTFSAVMFCAIRWRRGLPYALGLFFGTKQYAVLAVPLLVMLLEPGERWVAAARLAMKGALVAAIIALPFVLWNPHAFWRSIIQFQFMQPLRMDALSHLVWMRNRVPWVPFLRWLGFIGVFPAIALALVRCSRSPANFAGAFALVNLIFFAFGKQAFANYYTFTLGTAAWAAAAADTKNRTVDYC
jgi:hypothetical protein